MPQPGVPALAIKQDEGLDVLESRAKELQASSFTVVPEHPQFKDIKLGEHLLRIMAETSTLAHPFPDQVSPEFTSARTPRWPLPSSGLSSLPSGARAHFLQSLLPPPRPLRTRQLDLRPFRLSPPNWSPRIRFRQITSPRSNGQRGRGGVSYRLIRAMYESSGTSTGHTRSRACNVAGSGSPRKRSQGECPSFLNGKSTSCCSLTRLRVTSTVEMPLPERSSSTALRAVRVCPSCAP